MEPLYILQQFFIKRLYMLVMSDVCVHDCHLPILTLVRKAAPYPVFLLSYVLGFSFVAAVMFWGQKLVIRLVQRITLKNKK